MVNHKPLVALSAILVVSGALMLAIQHNPHLRVSLGLGVAPFEGQQIKTRYASQVTYPGSHRIPRSALQDIASLHESTGDQFEQGPIHTSTVTRVSAPAMQDSPNHHNDVVEPDVVGGHDSDADFIRLIAPPEEGHKQGWFVPVPDAPTRQTTPHIVVPPRVVGSRAGTDEDGDDVYVAAEPATATDSAPGVSNSHPVEPHVVSHLTNPVPLIDTGKNEKVEADVKDDEDDSFENTMSSILHKLKKHLADDPEAEAAQQAQQRSRPQPPAVTLREERAQRRQAAGAPGRTGAGRAKNRRWAADDDEDDEEDDDEEDERSRRRGGRPGKRAPGKRKGGGKKVVVHHHHHHYHGGKEETTSSTKEEAERAAEQRADPSSNVQHAHFHDDQTQGEQGNNQAPQRQDERDDMPHPADIFNHPFFSGIHPGGPPAGGPDQFGEHPFASPDSHPGFRVIRYVPHQGFPA